MLQTDKYIKYGTEMLIKLGSTDKFLCSENFLKRPCMFKSQFHRGSFNSAIFIIEGEDSTTSEFANQVSYSDWFYLRHKQTGKYLGLSKQSVQQPNDTTYKLELKEEDEKRALFRISQCYLYQSKISKNVKTDEDSYLAVKLNANKQVFLRFDVQLLDGVRAVCGYHIKQMVRFSHYGQGEPILDAYRFSTYVAITHSQTSAYLNMQKFPNLEFQIFEQDKDLDIQGIWVIEPQQYEKGGTISYDEKIRFRNIYTASYLSFVSTKPKQVLNQKFYPIELCLTRQQNTLFVLENMNKKDGPVKLGDYFTIQNATTKNYLGNIPNQSEARSIEDDHIRYIPTSRSQFNPADVYKFQNIATTKISSILLLITLQRQMKQLISNVKEAQPKTPSSWLKLEVIIKSLKESFDRTIKHLQKIQKLSFEIFSFNQRTFHRLISSFVEIVEITWNGLTVQDIKLRQVLLDMVKVIFQILKKVAHKISQNKHSLYAHMGVWLNFLCLNVEVQELIYQIFHSNRQLIFSIDSVIQPQNKTLLQYYIARLCRYNNVKNTKAFYQNVQKFINICLVVTNLDGEPISYNQTFVTQILLKSQKFTQLMFDFKVQNHRINLYIDGQWQDILKVKDSDPEFDLIVAEFNLLSVLCENRNLIARQLMSESFICDAMINYIQMPIADVLKSKIFKLITNIYIDSGPKTKRVIPYLILALSTQQTNESEPSIEQSEMRQALIRQKYNTPSRFKVKYKKLDLQNYLSNQKQNFSISHDDLDLYRMILQERILKGLFSQEMFQSIQTLVILEYLNHDEVKYILELLLDKLTDVKLQKDNLIIKQRVFVLLQLVSNLKDQINLNKCITLLKLLFYQSQNSITPMSIQSIVENYAKYILPNTEKLIIQMESNQKEFIMKHQDLINQYESNNNFVQMAKQYATSMIQKFNEMKDVHHRSRLFSLIWGWHFPYQYFLKLFSESCILTSNEDIELSNYLFRLYKKISKLSQCSEVWLRLQKQDDALKLDKFGMHLADVIDFFYDSHHPPQDESVRTRRDTELARSLKERKYQFSKILKYTNISIRRQILIRHVGFHELVFIFLEQNFFYMHRLKKQDKNNPIGKTFALCFQFLHGFIMSGNKKNKQELVKKIDLIFQYCKCINLGQYPLLAQLYNMYPDLCMTLSDKQIRVIIDVIRGDGKRSNNYNAFLLQFFMNTVESENKVITGNLQKLLFAMSNTFILRKLLFLEEKIDNTGTKIYHFNINVKQILNQNIPFIYHFYLLRIINLILLHLRAGVDKIKKILLETFSQNYLLTILSLNDHFTYRGIEPKLNFLLKLQVAKLIGNIHIYGQREPRRLVNSQALTNFLVNLDKSITYYNEKRIENLKQPQAKWMEAYEYYLTLLKDEFSLSYQDYLQQYFQPLLIHYKSLLERFKDSKTYKLSKSLCERLQDLQVPNRDVIQRKMTINLDIKGINQDENLIFKQVNFPMVSTFYGRIDQDNPLETFTKKMFVQICTNKKIRQMIVKEQESFFKDSVTSKKFKPLVQSLAEFMISLCKSFNDDTDSPEYTKQLIEAQKVLEFLTKFLYYSQGKKTEIIKIILQSQLIGNVFELIIGKHFKWDHPRAINLTVEFLNLINWCFQESNAVIISQLVKVFDSNNQFHRILVFMKDSILGLSVEKKYIHKINYIFDNIQYSHVTHPQLNPGLTCLKFISNLSRNSELYPFNQFLRRQKMNRISIDFLPIIVNTVSFLLLNKQTQKIMVNISNFQIARTLIKTIKDMMYGPYEQNQNFLIETKFPSIVLNLLKYDKCQNKEIFKTNQKQFQFVQIIKNKLDKLNPIMAINFQSNYNKYITTHDALINLLKESALDCIGQMILGNSSILGRLTIFIPEEYFKVNLIWVYNRFIEIEGGRLNKHSLDVLKIDEELMIKNPDMHPVLVTKNGFKLYQLIKLYEQFDNLDQTLKSEDQKQKDKKIEIVKKFFEMLKPNVLNSKQVLLDENVPYRKQIIQYKEQYSEAIAFFQSKTLSIEISFQDSIYKVFFPKISLCQYFDSTFERSFRQNASRVSQSSKLHSVMQTAFRVKDQLQVQQNFSSIMANIHSKFYKLVSFDNIMLLILIFSAIINVVLISQTKQPVFQFPDTNMWTFSQVKYIIPPVLAIFGIILFVLLFILLVFKFVPKAIALAKGQIKRKKQKQEESLSRKQKTYIYMDHIFSGQIIYCIILLGLLPLVVLNPILSVLCLFDILRLIDTGRTILGAIADSWKQLFATTGIFLMFNYLYSFITYVAYSDTYAPVCESLYHCFIFYNQFYFKAGQGLYGNLTKNYEKQNTISIQMILDLTYIILGAFVIKQIFTGTIIDKFSQIREQKSAVEQDEASRCFICGMERYQLEFQLQGFHKHLKETHNVLYYIYFIFYLQKKSPQTYNRLQKFVKECITRNNDSWFPSQNSLFKIKKTQSSKADFDEKGDAKEEMRITRKQNRKKLLRQIKKVSNGLYQQLKNLQTSNTKLPQPNKK